jgi:SNF2 family DNA or RNA helicase
VLVVDLHREHRTIYRIHQERARVKVRRLMDDLCANRSAIFQVLTELRELSTHAVLVSSWYTKVHSAKVDVLMGRLADVVAGGHRALVLSRFAGFLGLVRERLDSAGIAPHQVALVGPETDGPDLAEADYCFVTDPWCVPVVEAQVVYWLIAKDTIEEKMSAGAMPAARVVDSADDPRFDPAEMAALLIEEDGTWTRS